MQQFIATWGYLAVFVLMVAESACIPVPSEVIMLFGGALAAGAVAGTHLDIVGVVVAGVVGNVAGSYVAWAVGRYAGAPAWARWGRRVRLRPEHLARAQRWFDHHGAAAVFIGRLLPGVRTFISLPAGFAAMPPLRFGLYTVAGCIPWTAALGAAGYIIGANWQGLADAFHRAGYVVVAIAAAAVVAAVAVALRRGHAGNTAPPRHHRTSTDRGPDPETSP